MANPSTTQSQMRLGGKLLTSAPRLSPQTQRERERKSRERRAANLRRLRETTEALEYVLSIAPTLGDADDAVWSVILDTNALRVRHHLQRSARLLQEAQQLKQNQIELKRLLHEHRLASYAIAGLHATRPTNAWEACVEKWRAITLRYYEPLTVEECETAIEAAQNEMNAFTYSLDTQVIGASYLGWRVRRRIVQARDAIQFSFDKTLRGFPMADFVRAGWGLYTDYNVYKSIMDHRAEGWVAILQEVTPDMCVVRVAERFPSVMMDVHKLYLVSRIKTETGFVQFARSLWMPRLQNKTNEYTDMWASNFVWMKWDRLDADGNDFRVQVGGKLAGDDTNYAARWLIGSLGVVTRLEAIATKRGMLSNL